MTQLTNEQITEVGKILVPAILGFIPICGGTICEGTGESLADMIRRVLEAQQSAPPPPEPMQLVTPKQFVLAGKAVFTLTRPDGQHYTYRVNRSVDPTG